MTDNATRLRHWKAANAKMVIFERRVRGLLRTILQSHRRLDYNRKNAASVGQPARLRRYQASAEDWQGKLTAARAELTALLDEMEDHHGN